MQHLMGQQTQIMQVQDFREIVLLAIRQTQVGERQHLIIIIIIQFQGLIQGLVVRNAMWVVDITIHQILVWDAIRQIIIEQARIMLHRASLQIVQTAITKMRGDQPRGIMMPSTSRYIVENIKVNGIIVMNAIQQQAIIVFLIVLIVTKRAVQIATTKR